MRLLSEEEREEMYKAPKTVPGEALEWQWDNGAMRIIAPVFLPNGEELILYGTKRNKFSFALKYRKTQLIRRWDFKTHNNPDGRRISGPHKHKWTYNYGEQLAYEVFDVPLDDLNEALFAFLKECNITIEGAYQMVLM